MMTTTTILQLQGLMKESPWGMLAPGCLVAELSGETRGVRCAEFWMGAHPRFSAKILDSSTTLHEIIAATPEQILGTRVFKKFAGKRELPFLLKVLSIAEPLSIQAHPDSKLAAELHKKDPTNYPDPNHKPEIAIALTTFDALSGFRSMAAIKNDIARVPELRGLLRGSAIDKASLKDLYGCLMRADPKEVEAASLTLFSRLARSHCEPHEDWILKLQSRYPQGDIGLFNFYFLNLVRFNPGEALFMGANFPHAYLAGEIVECMANSDNVVRAGLTDKAKDVDTLIRMLHYETGEPEKLVPLREKRGVVFMQSYTPPIPEFSIDCIAEVSAATSLSTEGGVELLFCLEGQGELESSEGGSAGSRLPITDHAIFLVPGALREYRINHFKGTLFRVQVPL